MRLRVFIFLGLLGLAPAWAGPPVVIDFDQANPPYMYQKDGKLRGIFPLICQVAFKRMNVPVELRARPWARALDEVDSGEVGVCGLYKTSDRVQKWDFSHYLTMDTILVYARRDDPVGYRTTWDLWGHRIGVMRGWSYGDDFDRYRAGGMFEVSPETSDEQNFKMLTSNRIDCFLAIPISVAKLTPIYPDIVPEPVPVAVNPTFLAFSKAAHAQALLNRFDAQIRAMRASGEFKTLMDHEIEFWRLDIGTPSLR